MRWSASAEQFHHERRVGHVAAHQPVVRVVVVAAGHLAVLGEVVDADHPVPGAQQLFDDVSADEPRRPGHEHRLLHFSPFGRARSSALRSCATVSRGPKAKRYQRRYLGIQDARRNRDDPAVRSSQMVGISATGNRSRRALAVSSRPISKPCLLSMPTSSTNERRYALNEFVASRVPTLANSRRVWPAVRERNVLKRAPPTCWPPGHVARCGGDDDAAVDQPHQFVDLPRVVAAVGHRHDDDRRLPRGRCPSGSRSRARARTR